MEVVDWLIDIIHAKIKKYIDDNKEFVTISNNKQQDDPNATLKQQVLTNLTYFKVYAQQCIYDSKLSTAKSKSATAFSEKLLAFKKSEKGLDELFKEISEFFQKEIETMVTIRGPYRKNSGKYDAWIMHGMALITEASKITDALIAYHKLSEGNALEEEKELQLLLLKQYFLFKYVFHQQDSNIIRKSKTMFQESDINHFSQQILLKLKIMNKFAEKNRDDKPLMLDQLRTCAKSIAADAEKRSDKSPGLIELKNRLDEHIKTIEASVIKIKLTV